MSRLQKRPSNLDGEASRLQPNKIIQEPLKLPDPGRSCISCHKRKVRCDRKVPCTPCVRSDFSCSYPSSDRETAKRVSPFEEITNRLDRLESKLSEILGKQSLIPTSPFEDHDSRVSEHPSKRVRTQPPRPSRWEMLMRHGNQVHYVDNTNLLDLFQDEERMHPSGPQSEDRDSPDEANASSGLHLTLGITPIDPTSSTNLSQLCPGPQLALRLWTTYVDRVDPLLKILHIPTTQSSMISIIASPTGSTPSLKALTFAIYFAATTSLSDDEISSISSDSRSTLLKRYKNGLNQIIMEGNLLNEPDVTSLQAMTIFATCLRVHEISRSVWVLIGLAIRLAQSIGIHRDGESLKLTPFESEIRLRLWWQLCLLDSRAPEDHGFVHTIEHLNQGLRTPLNIDDNQLFPTMQSLPPESDSWTEMTFQLVQIEACRLLEQVVENETTNPADSLSELTTKRKMMESHKKWMDSRYFSKPTHSRLQRIASLHYHAACTKMRFVLQLREHIYASKNTSGGQADDVGLGKQCLLAAFQDIESNYLLLNGQESGRFAWVFRMYTKWYSLMYILRYLCTFPSSPESQKGWALVDRTVKILPYFHNLPDGESSSKDNGGSSVWRCMVLLYRQALKSRVNANQASKDVASSAKGANNTIQGAESQNVFPSGVRQPAYEQQLNPQPSTIDSMGDTVSQLQPTYSSTVDPTIGWQDDFLTFSDFAGSEMFYVPEWSDIVNRTFDSF